MLTNWYVLYDPNHGYLASSVLIDHPYGKLVQFTTRKGKVVTRAAHRCTGPYTANNATQAIQVYKVHSKLVR